MRTQAHKQARGQVSTYGCVVLGAGSGAGAQLCARHWTTTTHASATLRQAAPASETHHNTKAAVTNLHQPCRTVPQHIIPVDSHVARCSGRHLPGVPMRLQPLAACVTRSHLRQRWAHPRMGVVVAHARCNYTTHYLGTEERRGQRAHKVLAEPAPTSTCAVPAAAHGERNPWRSGVSLGVVRCVWGLRATAWTADASAAARHHQQWSPQLR